jgi:hypothetical protein
MVSARSDTQVEQVIETRYLWLLGHRLMPPVQRVILFAGESLA